MVSPSTKPSVISTWPPRRIPSFTSVRKDTNLVSGGTTGALAAPLAALAAGTGNSLGGMALMTNCLPPCGTIASSGTTKALGLMANTAVTRANMPGRKGPFCSPPALVRMRSKVLGGQPKLWGDGRATPRLMGSGFLAAGAEAEEAAGAEAAACDPAPGPGLLPPTTIGSPAVLANTARTPIERPLASMSGSTASTLALNKRPLKASSLTSMV